MQQQQVFVVVLLEPYYRDEYAVTHQTKNVYTVKLINDYEVFIVDTDIQLSKPQRKTKHFRLHYSDKENIETFYKIKWSILLDVFSTRKTPNE